MPIELWWWLEPLFETGLLTMIIFGFLCYLLNEVDGMTANIIRNISLLLAVAPWVIASLSVIVWFVINILILIWRC